MKFLPAVAVAVIALAGATDAFAQYGYGRRQPSQGGSNLGGLGGRYRYWTAKLSGDIEAEDGGLGGSTVSVNSTLGLDEKETINDFGLWLPNLPFIGQMNLGYWKGSFGGGRLLDSDLTFAGTVFPAGSDLDSRMDWKIWTLLWESGVSGGAVPGTKLSSGVNAQYGFQYLNVEADLSSPTLSEDAGLQAWIPVVGLTTRLALPFVSLEGQAVGANAFGISGVEGWIYDLSVTAQVQFSSFFGGVGYRWFTLDVKDTTASHAEEIILDVRVEGLYFEGGVRF